MKVNNCAHHSFRLCEGEARSNLGFCRSTLDCFGLRPRKDADVRKSYQIQSCSQNLLYYGKAYTGISNAYFREEKSLGTNFYLRDKEQEYEREEHLGKRSAAGHYCYDCEISLVTGLSGGWNVTSPHISAGRTFEACPLCGSKPSGNFYIPELVSPTEEQTAREETFSVRYSCSFGFAQAPDVIDAYSEDTEVVDEYGRVYTMREFRGEVLGKAIFFFTHHVGQVFS
ncbi:MAG: hypothetical protein G01um101448_456 [Parcubacteria group bacterium Gr01-1014_48]|nr:MAG: hypothetical protein Greene041614_278 [Parcubacteria group bacterium Greene0416_14]TSC73908.1 MAG: hypothetical protein G01um101448_456 [Parcubacteria group bacterium Gr01-1014_48]TSD00309.1 MAG: hypothetical protein Greene101415_900 [Parcubacteria group bacterium Greene1014_15]TSD06988.1 MAG: hypothetical protein Greene07144_1043 [Parcubacteria group bacterium Greene0714_4]